MQSVISRLGENKAQQRLYLQSSFFKRLALQKSRRYKKILFEILVNTAKIGFKFPGIWQNGIKNCRNIQVNQNHVHLPNLPAEFKNFTILQLSDLHINQTFGLTEILRERIAPLHFDLCVITGDYRWSTHGAFEPVMAEMEKLIPVLKKAPYGVLGILGNHDWLEFVPPLEAIGIKMLLNEGVQIRKNGSALGISGIDDVHYYFNADLAKASYPLTDCPVKILLAHSPESITEAEKIGFDLYLAGHTHGGQICLPNGRMVLHNSRSPRVFSQGAWQSGKMQGYTSKGTGSSGFPARFNCPPEITLHLLRDN